MPCFAVFCIVLHTSEGLASSPVLIDVLSFNLLNRSSKVTPVVSLSENGIKSRFYKETRVFHTTNGTLIFDQRARASSCSWVTGQLSMSAMSKQFIGGQI